MMRYREYKPCRALQKWIACYWTLSFSECTEVPEKDVVLPDGCLELIINLGEGFKGYDPHSRQHFKVREFGLIGQRRGAFEIEQTRFTSIFAIRFKPFGLPSLLNIDSSEITGRTLEAAPIRDRIVAPLRRILEGKADFSIRLEALEQKLITQLKPGSCKECIEVAVSHIIDHNGVFKVGDFCDYYGIHKSTLQKNFMFHVGLSPKEFAAIVRFNYTYRQLYSESYSNLAQAALEGGYYDQSHMIKDFKKFSGSTPSGFLRSDYLLPQIALEFNAGLQDYFSS